MSNEDRETALDYLMNKDLLANITNDIEKIGVIGEQKNALLFYLALTSRILPVPISVFLLSRSSAGKSFFEIL
jgi:hypothetical protein